MIDPNMLVGGLLMLVVLFTAFTAMAAYRVPQPLAMTLAACIFLSMQAREAEGILRTAFSHFADVAVLFTAVAIPAHMIDRSGAFRWVQGVTGAGVGRLGFARRHVAEVLVISGLLAVTYVLAAVMHNVTSILVMTSLAIHLCDKFKLPSRYVLCGMLIASNLGGFSTKWGDTPNIIESSVWGLSNRHFAEEILKLNLVILILLTVGVAWKTRNLARANGGGMSTLTDAHLARIIVDLRGEAGYQTIDLRLVAAGTMGLLFFIVGQALFPGLQIAIGAFTIVLVLTFDHPADRLESLKSLGYDTYLVFASIFVLAGCVEHSWIGTGLEQTVKSSGAAPWAIALTGYLGTTFTEAASWASAASTAIHPLDGSRTAAWALGAGICAGSSSLVTAASAGIVLSQESSRFKQHAISFRTYLPFGVLCSVSMLIIYIVLITLFY